MTTAVAVAPVRSPQRPHTLTGTAVLLRFALRRDRWRLPAWLFGLVATLAATAAAFPGIYPDQAARQTRALLMSSPAAVALGGPGIGVEDYTFGAMMTNEMLALTATFVALMSIFTVIRHSRADEETGRTELIRATPVGRHAPMAAALLVTLLANVILAVLVTVALAAQGLDSIDWPGSALYAAALAAVGITFAAVAAVTAQISEHARTASGLADVVLGVAFSVRAVGDVTGSWISWLSPLAWAQRTYAFVDNRWWPLLLALAATAGLVAVAARLSARRDFAAGLRRPRPGPAHGSPWLRSPVTLAARLQRGALVAWTASLLGFGLLYGTLLSEVQQFTKDLGNVPTVEKVLAAVGGGAAVMDSFLSLLVSLIAMTSVIFGVTAVLRARAEETDGLGELVLSTAVSRRAWLAGHAVVAVAGSAIVALAGSLGLGISGAAALGDAGVLGKVLGATLVQLAAMLVVIAIAVALVGLLPRAAQAVWLVVVYAMFVGTFGGLLSLPQWSIDVSPFAQVPMLPAEAFSWPPVLLLVAIAAALLAAGLAGISRRDLQTGG